MPTADAAPAPAICVIVCAYTQDRAPRLAAALDSLAAQSAAPCQIVVVVDHNPALLAWARGRFPDCSVVHSDGPPGLSGARNSGLRAARGDVIAFLDDDAVAAPDWLARLAAAYGDRRVIGVGGAVTPDWEARAPRWLPEEFLWVVGCSYRGMPTQRSAVRNVIGANMSFRREAFAAAGGFTTSLGRVGARPLGCEETELCIRVGRLAPGRTLVYEPAASVRHHVPRSRASWRYFVRRCFSEGRSKAEVARLCGRRRGLSSERAYTLRTLPAGFWRELRSARPSRAAAIATGLVVTAAGYAAGRASESTARAARPEPDPATATAP